VDQFYAHCGAHHRQSACASFYLAHKRDRLSGFHIAIKRGYSKDVLNYRVITVALLIGITIGYILGKLI
jgi:hypothetical protein